MRKRLARPRRTSDHSLLTPRADFVTSRTARQEKYGPGIRRRPAGGLGDVMAGSTAPTAVDHAGAGPRCEGCGRRPSSFWASASLLAAVAGRGRSSAHGEAASPAQARPGRGGAGSWNTRRRPGAGREAGRSTSWTCKGPASRTGRRGGLDLLGTARMRQAAQRPGTQAADLWAEARKRLEAAEKETRPGGRKRPSCNSAWASSASTRTTTWTTSSAASRPPSTSADDPVQGYTVLTQAYLQISPNRICKRRWPPT